MKKKGYAAPIIVSVLLLLFQALYALLWIYMPIPYTLLKIALALVQIGFSGVLIYVLIERIKEIRSGEEDDLSQY